MNSWFFFLLSISTLTKICNSVNGWSSLRKDYYLPQSLYDESFVKTPPNSGGRGHIVFTDTFINYSLPLTVSFNNGKLKATVSPSFNLMPTELDWIHCDLKHNEHQNTLSYSITFHTLKDSVISDIGSSLTITDSKNKQLTSAQFTFPPVGTDFSDNYPVWVTYIATDNEYSTIYVHLHNYDTSNSYTINQVLLNGVAIDNNITIPNNHHLLRSYAPNTHNLQFGEGDVWTIQLTLNNGMKLGWGGRFMKEFYVFESYSKGGQCPYPGANSKDGVQNYETFWNDLSIQTGFCQTGSDICNADNLNQIYEASMQTTEEYKILVGEHWTKSPGQIETKYFPAVIALEMGDEVDSHYNNTYQQWVESLNRRLWYPTLPTYQGGHVNHYIGAFAGITDVQSMDYYVAGCAPHVTSESEPMRIQGSRDYLFNTRENHKPLVTWGYTQAFYTSTNNAIHGNEYMAQFASVFSAGCKGVQLFQSDINQKSSNSDEWDDAQNINPTMYLLRKYFRIGDIMEMNIEVNGNPIKDETPQIINVIRSDGMLVIIVISTNASGYNQVLCTKGTHWNWKSFTINKVKINFPNDFNLKSSNNNIQEVKNGKIEPSNGNAVNGVTFTYNDGDDYFELENIAMGENPTIVRVFIVPETS